MSGEKKDLELILHRLQAIQAQHSELIALVQKKLTSTTAIFAKSSSQTDDGVLVPVSLISFTRLFDAIMMDWIGLDWIGVSQVHDLISAVAAAGYTVSRYVDPSALPLVRIYSDNAQDSTKVRTLLNSLPGGNRCGLIQFDSSTPVPRSN
jgi:hypothetical protein